MKRLLSNPAYDPTALLDHLKKVLGAKTDYALARELKVDPPIICKTRSKKLPVTANFLIRAHEVTGLSIGLMREIMGDDIAQLFEIGDEAKGRKSKCKSNAPSAAQVGTTPAPVHGA